MTKEKTMEELLEKVNIEKLKSVGVNDTEIAKVEALHDLLKKGLTYDDDEVRRLFGVLPDGYPHCTAYIHNEALVRIGKAKPIKVVPIPGEKDSRKKWVPIEKADELGVPATIPIKGYEIICASCENIFIGKEPFHQNFCHSKECAGSKPTKQKEGTTPDQKPKQKKDKSTPVDSTPTEKPKKRGRPKKSEPAKSPVTKDKTKAKRGRPPKKDSGKKASAKRTSSKSKGSPSRPTKKKGGTRKKK